ncbi:MAG: hypothetical protein M0D53_01050 [Flavobacterium sp. JAD_PAG50586_2]|nr:MAG: hypothetical protein M0D53_01050 [Flavobacterium sp. JAD_PAG50586_2]
MKNYCIYIMIMLFFLAACKDSPEYTPKQETEHHFVPHTDAVAKQTYHEDTTYKYEHRTGTSGDYQYNYDVSGTDGNGEEITGNISVQDKYGIGTLIDGAGNKIEVETEWTGKGKLKATDQDGNEYELDVD